MRGNSRLILALLALSLCAPLYAGAVAPDENIVPATPKARTQIAPYYPMTVSGLDADITLAVEIGANGKVDEIRVLDCSHPGLGFEEAARDAVKHWRFKPALSADGAVASQTFVSIHMAPPMASNMRYAQAQVGISMKRPVATGSAGFSTNHHGGRDTLRTPDRPPCGPTSGECIYDRSGFNQNIRVVELPSAPEPAAQPTHQARRQRTNTAARNSQAGRRR